MQQPSREISELIDAARSGSGSKLGNLLEHFRPQLLKQAEKSVSRALRRRMSISDLVQDTMLTATTQFPAFRGQTEPELQRWLHEVLRSRLVDGMRRHRLAERRRMSREVSTSGSQLMDTSPTAPQQVQATQEAEDLLLALDQLPLESQQIVRLRYLDNLTFEAIAKSLDLSLSSVWRRW
ncbi:MAG: sigma-70 family RNA polymerase sigma factor, partial [Pirellulaceae bacterium]|nr:sigma-70 family RNA polymerase sigma factor [Pirellulaceae bacterium]